MLWLLLTVLAQEKPVVLRIEPLEKVYHPGSPMPMRFTVENATDKEADLDEPLDYLDGLEIRDKDSRVLRTPGKLKEVKRRHKLDPRGFFGRTVDISKLLDIPEDKEGEYTIRWFFQDSVSADIKIFVIRDWIATIETNHGTIAISFHADSAPYHVLNFVALAKKGHYTDGRFYRVIPGFMMQGGQPTKTRELPPLTAEFNERKHVLGTVSMARTDQPNSATSEFFICFGPTAYLDRQYTVFGSVVEGIDVVQKVEKEPTDHNPCAKCKQALPAQPTQHCGQHHSDAPKADVVIKKITVSVRKK